MTITSLVHTVKREARIGYTSHTTSLIHGGGKLSFEVKRSLLQPAADVAGILRFNGSTLYIPRNRQITVGSSKECDIRIMDKRIDELHASITPFDGGFIINDLSLDNDLAVRDKVSGQITRLFSAPHEMTSDGSIFFRLSGIANSNKARLLEVKIEISPANITEAVQELFAAPRPAVEVVSPETALVRVKSNEEESPVTPRPEHRFKDFLANQNKAIIRNKVLALGALIYTLSAIPTSFLLVAINGYAACAVFFSAGVIPVFLLDWAKQRLHASDDCLQDAIRGATPNEIARSLSKLEKEDIKNILSSIKKFDRDLAMEIKKELKLLANHAANSPEQLPAELPAANKTRIRVAEPPTPVQEVVEVEVGMEETAEGKRSA